MGTAINLPADSDHQIGGRPRLDIVSDTICPWCYVGKRHLEAALPILASEGLSFDIMWRPFRLNPDIPKGGVDRRAYRSAKFGSWEKSLALDAQVAAAGAIDGLAFHHDRIVRTPNTVGSHILIRLAHEVGGAALQDRVVEALFAGYFTQGSDVGDPEVLADIGAAAGMERPRVLAAVFDRARGDEVMKEERLARDLHLNGVPSFVLDGKYIFSGAEPSYIIVAALRDAAAASAQLRRRGTV